jgi:hypothetical protein
MIFNEGDVVDVCPTCGQVIDPELRRRPDARTTYRRPSPHFPPHIVGIVAAPPAERWQSVEYRTPVRAATREADVIVPVMQAAITGVLGSVVIGIAMVAARLQWRCPWWTVPLVAVIAGCLITAAQWMRLLSETHKLLVKVKRLERPVDLGTPGTATRETLQVEIREVGDTNVRWTIDELPISRQQLAAIARSVRSGAHRWSRRDLATSGIGDDRAREILAALEQYGYLAYPNGRNHPDGACPTAKGRALFGAL